MILTDEQKAQADSLLLTYTEMVAALKMRLEPETYARHKQEMQAQRDAWDAKMTALGDYAVQHARDWPRGRGQPLPPEDDSTEA